MALSRHRGSFVFGCMDTTLQRESTEILTRELDDVMAVRAHLRWVARGADSPDGVERMGALLQSIVDALAARVLELGSVPMEDQQGVLQPPRMDVQVDVEHVSLVQLFAILVRYTRIRADVARSFGDARSASLLVEVRRGLAVLHWQARLFPRQEQ